MSKLEVQQNVDLRQFNTLGVSSNAKYFVRLEHEEQLPELVKLARELDLPYWVLGGGSNVVLPSILNRLVIKIELKGRACILSDQTHHHIRVAAGENWHEFVEWTIDQGYPGLENLALIPGSAGAGPVQNVGAYGVEVRDYCESVRVWNWQTRQIEVLNNEACEFSYRDSIFKKKRGSNYLILSVDFKLPIAWKARVEYQDVQRYLANDRAQPITPQRVMSAICSIRSAKLPDPNVIGNAGSFFKNPIVSVSQFESLFSAFPEMVHYPAGPDKIKLAAGWLIESAGWKGRRVGEVGVYEKQALVLVNHGASTGSEIRTLASFIQVDVRNKFGVELEVEPIYLD